MICVSHTKAEVKNFSFIYSSALTQQRVSWLLITFFVCRIHKQIISRHEKMRSIWCCGGIHYEEFVSFSVSPQRHSFHHFKSTESRNIMFFIFEMWSKHFDTQYDVGYPSGKTKDLVASSHVETNKYSLLAVGVQYSCIWHFSFKKIQTIWKSDHNNWHPIMKRILHPFDLSFPNDRFFFSSKRKKNLNSFQLVKSL